MLTGLALLAVAGVMVWMAGYLSGRQTILRRQTASTIARRINS